MVELEVVVDDELVVGDEGVVEEEEVVVDDELAVDDELVVEDEDVVVDDEVDDELEVELDDVVLEVELDDEALALLEALALASADASGELMAAAIPSVPPRIPKKRISFALTSTSQSSQSVIRLCASLPKSVIRPCAAPSTYSNSVCKQATAIARDDTRLAAGYTAPKTHLRLR